MTASPIPVEVTSSPWVSSRRWTQLISRSTPAEFGQLTEALDGYLTTLPPHWARILGGYRIVDIAHKVVGVG